MRMGVLCFDNVARLESWEYHNEGTDWFTAAAQCRADGGNLVSIHAFDEDEALVRHVFDNNANAGHLWLGGNDLNTEVR